MKYKPSEKSLANLRPPFGKGDKEEERKLQSKGGKAGGAGRVRNNIYRKLFREAFEINEKDIRVGVGNKMIEGDARILELGAKLNGELNPAAVAVDVGVALSASPLADLAKILGKTPTDDEGLQDEVLAKDN